MKTGVAGFRARINIVGYFRCDNIMCIPLKAVFYVFQADRRHVHWDTRCDYRNRPVTSGQAPTDAGSTTEDVAVMTYLQNGRTDVGLSRLEVIDGNKSYETSRSG